MLYIKYICKYTYVWMHMICLFRANNVNDLKKKRFFFFFFSLSSSPPPLPSFNIPSFPPPRPPPPSS